MKSLDILKQIMLSINYDEMYEAALIDMAKINEFKRPNSLPKIKKILSLDGDSEYNIMDYLKKNNPDEYNFYKFFLKTIPSRDSMNPHVIPYPSKKYFVSKSSNGKTLSHLLELNNLLKIKNGKVQIKEYKDGILHIGEKGSGKTFSQNVWLHDNHLNFEQNNIFWVRLDFSKLIDIWKDTKAVDTNNYLSTEDYFMGQISYVFAKHFIKDFEMFSPFIGKIVDELNNNDVYNYIDHTEYDLFKSDLNTATEIEFVTKYFKKRNINKITDALYFFEEIIAKYEHFYDGKYKRKKAKDRRKGKKGYLVDKVFVDSYKRNSNNRLGSLAVWTFVGQQIREFILEQNYHILYIVDGIDNINFHHNNRENFISESYNQLLQFPLKEERINDNEIVLLSLRDTSLRDLINKITKEEYIDRTKFREIENFNKIYQDSIGIPKEALNKRIEIVLKEFEKNKSMIKNVLEVMLKYNNIIDEKRWYSNIRTFIYNHLNLAKFIAYRYYFAGKPNDFNIKSQIDTFENINFLLNGNLFINEIINIPKSNSGYNFFNLFGYYNKKNQPKYFIYTRILQIILNEQNINENELYNRLDAFNYLKEDIDFCVDRLYRRGMIKINYTEYAKYNSILYSITEKGEFALKIFYSDIHYLYHTSLDTLLPISIINRLKYSPNHFNKGNSKTFYPVYSIITGLTFLMHLIKCNNYSLELIKNSKNIDISNFKLPIDNKVLEESIKKMIDSIVKDDDIEYLTYLKNHFKIK